MLQVSNFAGCCGSVILYNFYNDVNLRSSSGDLYLKNQNNSMSEFFRLVEDREKSSNLFLTRTSFVHAVLNDKQMMNEELLLRYDFKKVSTSRNINSGNVITNYIRTYEDLTPQRNLKERMFGT